MRVYTDPAYAACEAAAEDVPGVPREFVEGLVEEIRRYGGPIGRVGYGGRSEIDAAAFYCPYVPLASCGVAVDRQTHEVVTGLYTRYGYVEFK